MNNSKNSVLDQLAQSCCETGSSVLSTEQLRSILLSAAYKVPDMPVNTEGLKKALLIFDQALKLPDNAWISFEEVEASLEDVKPYLSPDINETINREISAAKTPDNKIQQIRWKKFILESIITPVIVSLITSGVNRIASKERDRKEETSWSTTAEYQQEDLAIEKRILELLEEGQDTSDIHVEIGDEPIYAEQRIVDSVNSDIDTGNANS